MGDLKEELQYFQTGDMVRTFKTLQFLKDGKVIENVSWRTIKGKELFCYLLHHKTATKEELINLLWPEYPEDKALQNLYTTIYQIKSLLKTIEFNVELMNTVGRYELVLNDVVVDVDVFEKVFNEFEGLTSDNYRLYDKLMKYYPGDYLQDEKFTWTANKKESIKILYITMLSSMIDFLKEDDKYFDALLLALTIQNHYPKFQNNYLVLMQLYDIIGEPNNVHAQYRLLMQEINGEPSSYIKRWYVEWTNHNESTGEGFAMSY